MPTPRTLVAGLRALFRKSRAERDLNDEVTQYIEAAAAEKMKDGASRDEALRLVRLEFGGVEAVKEEVRAARWETVVESVYKDFRFAARALWRSPAYSWIAFITLALGIGLNTAMFSVVNAVMLRPLPYASSGELTMIWTDDARRGLHREFTAYATVMDWRERSQSFADIAFFSTQRSAIASGEPGGSPLRTRSAFVSGNLFDVLGVRASEGRAISSDDESTRQPVIVISHSFWQRHFSGAPDVVGRSVTFTDFGKSGPTSFTVAGVLPEGFYFPDRNTEIWMPATLYWRFDRETGERFQDWARRWTGVGRLKPGVTAADAAAELDRIGARLTALYPTNVPGFPGFSATVLPMLDFISGRGVQATLWLLLGAVGLVLLAACANVANLMLARGAARQREFAVRRALGAGRGRLVRQLACESVVLAVAGGAAGLALAAWTTSAIAAYAGAFLPRMDELTIDARVLAFALVSSLVAALVFGAVPAFRLSLTDANRALREGSRGTLGAGVRRHHNALVLVECGLAVVLLAGAGLLVRSLIVLTSVDPGFDPRQVLTLRIELPPEPPPTAQEQRLGVELGPSRAAARVQLLRQLLDQVSALSGVEHAGMVDDLFIGGQGNESIAIPGRTATELTGELNAAVVSPGFFETMRVPVRAGRQLTPADTSEKIRALWSPILPASMPLEEKLRRAVPEPVVVNEAFVRRFFSDENPIGTRFCIDPTGKTYWYTIVGVVGNMRRQGLEAETIPEYFGPYLPQPTGRADVVVRTTGDPLVLAPAVRKLVAEAFPGVAIPSTSTAEVQFGQFSAGRRFQTTLLTAFAVLGVLLAAVGIFGLVHYAVAERTREMGVRIAMGATSTQIVGLVLWQGMRMPLIGIGAGLLVAAALTRVLTEQLYGIRPVDPPTFTIVGALLALVAAVACYLPARRASRIDPVRALRQE